MGIQKSRPMKWCLVGLSLLTFACTTLQKSPPPELNLTSECGNEVSYPIPSLPRYFRYEMIRNLQLFTEKGQSEGLAAYRFWYDKWLTVAPKESLAQCERVSPQKPIEMPENLVASLNKNFSQHYEAQLLFTLVQKSSLLLNHQSQVSPEPLAESLARLASARKQKTDLKIQNQFFNSSIQAMQALPGHEEIDFIIAKLANKNTLRVVQKVNPTIYKKALQEQRVRPFFKFDGLAEVILSPNLVSHPNESLRFQNQHKSFQIFTKNTPCFDSPAQLWIVEKAMAHKAKPIDKVMGSWICLSEK